MISVDGVSKKFCRDLKTSLWYGMRDIAAEILCSNREKNALRSKEFWALQNVSFELNRGDCLGLIGKNGAGKSTLLKLLAGLIKPDSGKIVVRGRLGALISLGAGFNPVLTGRENIYINASILGIAKSDIDSRFEEIVEFAELNDAIDSPVRTYSSGMHVRLGFAVATAMSPDVLLIDEVLAVGDADFRAKCMERIGYILKDTAVIFVSHNTTQIQRICNRVMWIDQGVPKLSEDVSLCVSKYLEETVQDKKQKVLNHGHIEHFEIRLKNNEIRSGEDVPFILTFHSSQLLVTGLCLCNIADQSGELAAQADFSHLLKVLPKGHSNHELIIRNLRLSAGTYYIHISIFSRNRKQTILHARNCAQLSVEGPVGFGPNYQLGINSPQ